MSVRVGEVVPIPTRPELLTVKNLELVDEATEKMSWVEPPVPTTTSLDAGVEVPTPTLPPLSTVNTFVALLKRLRTSPAPF